MNQTVRKTFAKGTRAWRTSASPSASGMSTRGATSPQVSEFAAAFQKISSLVRISRKWASPTNSYCIPRSMRRLWTLL